MFFARRAGMKFINRGDPAGWDFDKNDFTCDSSWHALSLASIVPANTKIVEIGIEAQRPDTSRLIQFCTAGYTNRVNASWLYMAVAGQFFTDKVSIYMGGSNIIDYKADNGVYTSLNMVVCGWWL